MSTPDRPPSWPSNPSTGQPTDENDTPARDAAITRIRRRRGFWRHLATYTLVNLLLVGIWAGSGAGYFWPVWPMLGWGFGVAAEALRVFGHPRPISEQQIRREIDRGDPQPGDATTDD